MFRVFNNQVHSTIFSQLIFSCKYFDKIQFNLRTLNLWIAFRAYLLMRVQLILFFHIISGKTIEYSNLMGSWGAPRTLAQQSTSDNVLAALLSPFEPRPQNDDAHWERRQGSEHGLQQLLLHDSTQLSITKHPLAAPLASLITQPTLRLPSQSSPPLHPCPLFYFLAA